MSLRLFRHRETGPDGVSPVQVLEPKLNVSTKLISSKVGIQVPEIDYIRTCLLELLLESTTQLYECGEGS
ncbi:unnamed protein product [Lactuca virosa]|uniref:Uncharacterized protein n=1 Tax=Lactuca virosa TaxID=75947 RepID=A0AAU9MVS5_9ASTR|nr:unnamed protein product [Lactuca virosa]